MTLTFSTVTYSYIDGFIAEEYDKNDRRVPKWKVKWCQDNLKYMIGKDDNRLNMSQMGKSQLGKS